MSELRKVSVIMDQMTNQPDGAKAMKLAYIAGPYRAATKGGILLNIQNAANIGAMAAEKGYAIIVPHCNSYLPDKCGTFTDRYWLDMDLEVLSRCDLVVLVPGWEQSAGTRAEVEFANERGIPVYEASALVEASI